MARMCQLLFAFVVFNSAVGCAECETDRDCGDSESCFDGVCGPLTNIAVTSSTDVASVFDVEIAARFEGRRATVTVKRSEVEPGDACVAFAPITVELQNDGAAFDVVTATIPDLGALGPRFRLVFTLAIGGISTSTSAEFTAPALADGIGGFELRLPIEGDVDVVETPMASVETVGTVGTVTATVVPVDGVSLPRATLFANDDGHERDVLLARGRQQVVVEATVDGVVKRCTRFLTGSAREAGSDVEFLLVADSIDDDNNWLELTSLRTGGEGAAVCDGTAAARANCASSPTPLQAGQRTIDGLTMAVTTGFIDVAVVPVIASGPVDAVVRVTHRGVHVGVFGPITLRPDAGESWIAGRVILRAGGASVAPSTSAPQPAAPW